MNTEVNHPPLRGTGGGLGGLGGLQVRYLIIHCSAVRPSQTSSAAQIDSWHRQIGWNGIGYHYVIRRDGTVEKGRPEWQVGAHCKGYNEHSLGICYEGGLNEIGKPIDTRTPAQRQALIKLLVELKTRYKNAKIVGHRDLDPTKACPCFDAAAEYGKL